MKTASEVLGTGTAGRAYGHVPGHQYHDVDVVISRYPKGYKAHVVETWGSAQGYDEEHGRREVTGRGGSIASAVADATRRANMAEMDMAYVVQALSRAEDEAE